jgi:hypothetical protein
MTCKGINVYHVYKDDDIEQGPRTYSFSLDAYNSEYDGEEGMNFDVRELPNWTEPPRPDFISLDDPPRLREEKDAAWKVYHQNQVEAKHIRKIIREAVKLGYITADAVSFSKAV